MKVIFKPEAYTKMFHYIDAVTTEISGFGKVSVDKNNNIIVEDVKIFKQTVSSAETELDDTALSNFLMELVESKEDPYKWKLWWHSHANMGVFWSGTDIATMTKLGLNNDWQISIVGNRKHELKCRVNIYKPFHYHADNLDWEVESMESKIPQEILDEVKEKVSTPVCTYPVYDYRAIGYGHYIDAIDDTRFIPKHSKGMSHEEKIARYQRAKTSNKFIKPTTTSATYSPDFVLVEGKYVTYKPSLNKEIVEYYCKIRNIKDIPNSGTKEFFELLNKALKDLGNE